jgi:hypothetical protein
MKSEKWVIRLSPQWPVTWLTLASDEDDGDDQDLPFAVIPRTCDITLALPFDTKAQADAHVNGLIAEWHELQFLVESSVQND